MAGLLFLSIIIESIFKCHHQVKYYLLDYIEVDKTAVLKEVQRYNAVGDGEQSQVPISGSAHAAATRHCTFSFFDSLQTSLGAQSTLDIRSRLRGEYQALYRRRVGDQPPSCC